MAVLMKSRNPRKPPAYRLHKPTGQAVVRLDGRDLYLGKHGTEVSHDRYRRLIAEWLTAGSAPSEKSPAQPRFADLTIHELVLAYWRHAEAHYRDADGRPTNELGNIRDAIRPLRQLYGDTRAGEFGPLALRAVRDAMIRSGLARTTVNARVNRMRRMFRWSVSHELIPAPVFQALASIEGLKRWRSDAKESDPIVPVPVEHVEACLPFLPRPVAAMVRLQLLLGCRTEEILSMRGAELTREEPNWVYRPRSHKNAWRGQSRFIVLGPRARAIVCEFLRDDPEAYLFRPQDAVVEHHGRRTSARRSRPTPSELARRRHPGDCSKHGEQYSRRSYRQAILRACGRASVPAWTPLQLRHTAATRIRNRFGVEAAQLILGHAQIDTTELYTAKDLGRAREIMSEMG